MEKLVVSFVLFVSLAMVMAEGTSDQWVNMFNKANEKVTHLRFYVQDVITGPNSTVASVAYGGKKSLFSFGNILIIDDCLTNGPEPTSNQIGRVQGINGFADLEEKSFLNVVTFVFTSGEFNGSSLIMVGPNEFLLPVREIPIVGGTGFFRLARGFATTKTVKVSPKTFNGVYEYNVVVFHY